jgi:hypothetical protein
MTTTRRTPRKRKTQPQPTLNMEAAARALYENFVRVFQIDRGVTVDGRRKAPAPWDQNKEFQRKNWREVAQAVVDAATGVERKKRNTA